MHQFPSPAPTKVGDLYAREQQTAFHVQHCRSLALLPGSLGQPGLMDFLWLSEGLSFQRLLQTGCRCICFWTGISAGNPFPDMADWGYLGCDNPARNGGAGRAGPG